jgi:hypothetical protein
MILFAVLTVIFSLIGVLCLRKKFSYGVVAIVVMSSIAAGIVWTIIETSRWYIEGPDTEEVVTERIEIIDFKKFLENEYHTKPKHITKVVVNDTITHPFVVCKETRLRKEINMFWPLGHSVNIKYELNTNKKDHALFQAHKDSVN